MQRTPLPATITTKFRKSDNSCLFKITHIMCFKGNLRSFSSLRKELCAAQFWGKISFNYASKQIRKSKMLHLGSCPFDTVRRIRYPAAIPHQSIQHLTVDLRCLEQDRTYDIYVRCDVRYRTYCIVHFAKLYISCTIRPRF
jgi:hypothetical protein